MIGLSVYNNDGKDYKYEYDKVPLTDMASKFIYIPLSVIVNKELDIKRISVLSYLRIHCGLNDLVGFTISDVVEWCGMKPNNRDGKVNDKFLDIMDGLINEGYLTYLTQKNKSNYMKCQFNMNCYYEKCSEGYAVLYLDEIEKIMNFKSSQGNSISNTTLLLIFAYFRNKIKRRPNELKPEERTLDGIQKRRERIPDAYDSNITDIAKELGMHKQTLSKAIDILEQELELIITDKAYRVKNENSEFRTLPTIFANAYKREDRYLLVSEEEYGRTEIELKAQLMKQYYQDYNIDKRKRIKKAR